MANQSDQCCFSPDGFPLSTILQLSSHFDDPLGPSLSVEDGICKTSATNKSDQFDQQRRTIRDERVQLNIPEEKDK